LNAISTLVLKQLMNYVHGFHPTETAANTLRWWLRKMKPVIFPVWRQMV